MIKFVMMLNKARKIRLVQFYDATPEIKRPKMVQQIAQIITEKQGKVNNVYQINESTKIVYRRYASLYFVFGTDLNDNELLTLEQIQFYVELLDQNFGSVCELDLIFNYDVAYNLLNEIITGGMFSETSRNTAIKACEGHDQQQNK